MSINNNGESNIILNRLILALEKIDIVKWGRVKKIAVKTGYSEGQVSAILAGKESINDRFKKAVCQAYLISEGWLGTGEGEMFVKKNEQPQTISDQLEGYSPEVKLAADYFEVKLRGKTAEERLKFVEEIMEDVRRKYK